MGNWLAQWQVAPWMQSLILDGIIAGVGAVLDFTTTGRPVLCLGFRRLWLYGPDCLCHGSLVSEIRPIW